MESKTFEDSAWKGEMSEQLVKFWKDAVLCDIVLECGEVKMPAHRNILGSVSPYFRAILTDDESGSKVSNLTVNEMEHRTLEELIRYCYTGRITVTSENVHNLMEGSDFLELISVRDACECYLLENIGIHNVIQRYQYADLMNCKKLFDACESFLIDMFGEITKSKHFLSCNFEILRKLLQNDILRIEGEGKAYETCLKWIEHDKAHREYHFEEIFANIELNDLPEEYVSKYIDEEPMVLKSTICVKRLLDSKNSQLLPSRARKLKPVTSCKRVLVFGTKPGSELLTFEVFDPLGEKWLESDVIFRKQLPDEWSNCQVVSWGSKICRLNFNERVYSNFWLYESGKSRMISMPKFSRTAFRFVTFTVHNRLYFFISFTQCYHEIWYFCMESETWTQVGNALWDNLIYGQAMHMNGLVYITGERSWSGNLTYELRRYNIESKSVISLKRMLDYREFHAASCLNGMIYVAGGKNSQGKALKSVEVYDPLLDEWQYVAEMKFERVFFRLIPIMNKLWAIGGRSTSSRNTIEIYDPASDQWSLGPELTENMTLYGCGVINGN